ncbi:peptidase [Hydrogenophaga sp. A37]|uniref:peptidase n=1 Tax=Hydrogenophaga sp. A37 TaxID=1945864 RepID=UPI00209A9A80|nr:peptidase [Hydrogenophaga sp. A37]
MRRIHNFKAGRHTASSGLTADFTEAQLLASAEAYDPALSEAALVVGHPKTDAPAYGWVKSLAAVGTDMFAEPHQVNPEFADLVKSGAFKKISSSFYTPDHPNNPVPGVYYLRHIGFLGAQPPAVKGLKPIEFSDDADCIELELDFAEGSEQLLWATEGLVSLFKTLRDHLIEKEGAEAADKVLPAWRLDSAAESLARARAERDAQRETQTPRFSEATQLESTAVTPEEKAALEQRNTQLEADLAAAKAKLRDSAVTANTAAHAAFAETLAGEARIAPADKAVVTALLDFAEPAVIEGESATVVEFGEGEAEQTIGAAIKAFLGKLPKRVEFGEQAGRDRAAEGQADKTDGVQYAEGTPADTIALDKRIRAYATEHKLSYADAAGAVARG